MTQEERATLLEFRTLGLIPHWRLFQLALDVTPMRSDEMPSEELSALLSLAQIYRLLREALLAFERRAWPRLTAQIALVAQGKGLSAHGLGLDLYARRTEKVVMMTLTTPDRYGAPFISAATTGKEGKLQICGVSGCAHELIGILALATLGAQHFVIEETELNLLLGVEQ